MSEPLFLKPVFKERIWGGTALRDEFGYEIPSEITGECWAVSAHPHGQSVVKNGPFEGRTLGDLWENEPGLFGYEAPAFPLLTKILDAALDLSVQVHPDDEYANKHENGELGKTESWYIIDCKPGAEMVFGHTAKSKQELVDMVDEGKWDRLLRRVNIKPGDFLYVPSGTVHAICEGTLVLETQQSSDTTYRVYDYDRVDQEGKKRELHLDRALDVITVPHRDESLSRSIRQEHGATITTFIENEFFSVYKWEVDGSAAFTRPEPFLLVSVLEGQGEIVTAEGSWELKKGDHFVIPQPLKEYTVKGTLSAIVSRP